MYYEDGPANRYLKLVIGFLMVAGIMLDTHYLLNARSSYIAMFQSYDKEQQIIDKYLDQQFYDLTYKVYVPLLGLIHLPLNLLILHFLFIDASLNSPFAPYLRLILLILESISLLL
jgi:hypothetical protein